MVLLLGGVAVAALLTWFVPAGAYDRVVDEATGRTIAVAGTYQSVEAAPVTPFQAVLAVPKGLIEGIEVILTILLVGGAWYIVDRLGVLGRAVGALAGRFPDGSLGALPFVVLFFAAMGAAENMQEEIIALVPALLVLGRRLRVDPLAMVAASAGAAMVGSAFGPTNPFQAGIALTLAELPLLTGVGVRSGMLVAGVVLWTWWTMRWARANRVDALDGDVTAAAAEPLTGRDVVVLACVILPLVAYIYGALALGWGFNDLSAAYFIGAVVAGLVGRWHLDRTISTYIEGMQAMLPAALLVGVARSIAVVLADGRIIDTILHAMATPLADVPTAGAALLMVPMQALLHVPVVSVSGQAALTMPILIPLSDLIGLSRNVTVLAYQTGAGLAELLTPTNGALLAILLAAGTTFQRWLRFAIGGYLLMLAVGVTGILAALALGL
jgi:uncharacterized ion transporter superfamily protein YfcC